MRIERLQTKGEEGSKNKSNRKCRKEYRRWRRKEEGVKVSRNVKDGLEESKGKVR